MVIGGDSCSQGHEFESMGRILNGSHLFAAKFELMFGLKRPKINEKEDEDGHLKRPKTYLADHIDTPPRGSSSRLWSSKLTGSRTRRDRGAQRLRKLEAKYIFMPKNNAKMERGKSTNSDEIHLWRFLQLGYFSRKRVSWNRTEISTDPFL